MRLSPLLSLAVALPTVPPLLSLAANILLPTVFAKSPASSQHTPTAVSTATTPALQAVFTYNPILAILDLGRSWTEAVGSAKYVRELVSLDERVAREMKEKEVSGGEVAVGDDERNKRDEGDQDMEGEGEPELEKKVEKGRKCWFFHCEGWQW